MNLSEKLLRLMAENKMRTSDVARGSELPYTTVDGIIKSGGDNAKLGTLVQLANFFNISIDYLVNDDYTDKAFLDDKDVEEVVNKYTALDDMGKHSVKIELNRQYERIQRLTNDTEEYVDIPYFEDKAAAGTGYELGDGRNETMRLVRSRKTDRADFIVTVSGNSMEPEFYDGENVLVHAQPDIFEGEIGIFVVNGKGFIKKKGKNRLISLNHKYRDIFISEEDKVLCAGKVVGKLDESDYAN